MSQAEWIQRFVAHALTLEAAELLDASDLDGIAKKLLTASNVIKLQPEVAADVYFAL